MLTLAANPADDDGRDTMLLDYPETEEVPCEDCEGTGFSHPHRECSSCDGYGVSTREEPCLV